MTLGQLETFQLCKPIQMVYTMTRVFRAWDANYCDLHDMSQRYLLTLLLAFIKNTLQKTSIHEKKLTHANLEKQYKISFVGISGQILIRTINLDPFQNFGPHQRFQAFSNNLKQQILLEIRQNAKFSLCHKTLKINFPPFHAKLRWPNNFFFFQHKHS